MKATPQLTELLNKVEAMLECGAGTISELAAFILPDKAGAEGVTRCAEWVRRRAYRPNGEITLRIQSWAAVKTLEISHGGRESEDAYKAAFKAVCARHG